MKLYYHKTDGGAEYLTDTFIACENGHKEGCFNGAKYIVRIDGDITKDAELQVSDLFAAAPELLEACKRALVDINELTDKQYSAAYLEQAIAKAENKL